MGCWFLFMLPLAMANLEPFALPPGFEGTWQGVPYASVVGPWSENFTFSITRIPQGDYLKWPGYIDSEHPFPFKTLGCYTAGPEEGCGCFNWTLRVDESGTTLDYQVSMAGSPLRQHSKHVWATLKRVPYVATVDLHFPGPGGHFDCDYTHRDEHQTPLASCPFALYYRPPAESSTVARSTFEHCYNLDAKVGLVLEWDLDEKASLLHVQISALAEAADYVSVGFRPLGGSSSGEARRAGTGREQRFGMRGADIVLGHSASSADSAGVERYYASAYSGAPGPDESLEIWNASVERRGGRIALEFRRPLVSGYLFAKHGINASILSDLSDMMWAVGRWDEANQVPSYHGALRGWREVNWTDPEFDSRPLLSLRPYRCGMVLYP